MQEHSHIILEISVMYKLVSLSYCLLMESHSCRMDVY